MLQTVSEARSKTHGKFIWCELMTPDTDAAGKFYSSVVGWKVKQVDMPDIDFPYFLFEMGEGENCPGIGGMMNFPPELEGKIPPNWTGYVAVDDVDQTAREFTEHGGAVQRPPEDIPGIGRFAVLADPHGAVICVMKPLPMDQPPPPELAPEDVGAVGWHELYAGDGAEALDFYGKVFGWTLDQDCDIGEMGVYKIFAHNGQMIGGMMTKPADMPACWAYYFTVEAIDAAAERVKAGGGKIVMGPMQVPSGGWIVQCTDPQGAFFALSAAKR
ncbi:VOC family protein [Rhizobium sp. LC145]|uniref:VOC family protein n=1 Tax=Rhizobium sp. LC145 TaxID=1120688 RepID=UPI00062A28C5|nr:VOC family protein [Rhizobium sp. LC145]KKX28158.1 glyoxalase [Rhizobium sp. LC145]TKT54513.1 VOC family protein [Rhizobiaceae bacterium LC148]